MRRADREREENTGKGSASILLAPSGILPDGSWSGRRDAIGLFAKTSPMVRGNMPALPIHIDIATS
jgi:hypothetical protein